MQTVGIDVSAEPKGTAIATITWHDDQAVVSGLHTVADDPLVLRYLHHPDSTVGVDCPLGWPATFVEFISAHQHGVLNVDPNRPSGWRRNYVMRQTDLYVRRQTGIVPLSVAADRISATALRLAALIAEVGDHVDTSRDGSGAIIEVYPAASLKLWGLPSRGYKRRENLSHLNELVDTLQQAIPWLDLGEAETVCRTSDDAFDAIICALTAKAAKTGHTQPPEETVTAQQEGWIHLPAGPLPQQPWC